MKTPDDDHVPTTPDTLKSRVQRLALHGLLAHWDEVADKPWLAELCAYEERERHRRSLERRLRYARIGAFKSMTDFDWSWPKKIDKDAALDLLSGGFLDEGINAILLGPNGVGKTMLLRNIAHQAVQRGHTVRLTTASDMLSELAAQESSAALKRRLRRYCQPKLLCIDEVGYLSYDVRHADLLFEVVTRRHEKKRSIVLTTNKAFAEWPTTFPNAACVVALVDRLINRADVVVIDGESYRLHEAEERQRVRATARKKGKERAAR